MNLREQLFAVKSLKLLEEEMAPAFAGAHGGRGERRVRLTRKGVLLSNEVFSLLV